MSSISNPYQTQNSVELQALGDKIVNLIQSKKPEWKYEAVTPIRGSTGVIVQQWTLDDVSVRIAIISHNSSNDAVKAIQDLSRHYRVTEQFQDLGDGGIRWGQAVSFRKRNFTIDVSAVSLKSSRDTQDISRTADQCKLGKEFADLVAEVVKNNF